jgi:transposase
MKSTQNEKISQIKFETLVVGIDIGKETHYARAFDYRGIELARPFSSITLPLYLAREPMGT